MNLNSTNSERVNNYSGNNEGSGFEISNTRPYAFTRTSGAKSLREIENEVMSFKTIPKIAQAISIFLDAKSLFNFELTEKCLNSNVIDMGWAFRKQEHFINFRYGGCEDEPQRNKCEFIISKKIEEFMLVDKFFGKHTPDILKQVQDKYSPLWERFPFLHAFFQNPSDNPLLTTSFKESYSKENAGDLMLMGMILANSNTDLTVFKLIKTVFLKAIEKNATCVSLYSEALNIPESIRLEIAQHAAKYGDERDLYAFLTS